MSKATKVQLEAQLVELKARNGELEKAMKEMAEGDQRHFEWQWAIPSWRQPKEALANLSFRMTKKGVLIGTGVVATLELVDGKPKLVPIKTNGGFPLFGFVDPEAADKMAKYGMMLVDCDQLPDKYPAKVHGNKSKVEKALAAS